MKAASNAHVPVDRSADIFGSAEDVFRFTAGISCYAESDSPAGT